MTPPRTSRASDAPVTAAIATQSGLRDARTRTVIVYLIIAGCAVVPGLLAKLEWRTGTAETDVWLSQLQAILADIRFGGGGRFWIGVVGACLLALPLLYPVRKIISNSRWLGSVGGWFHLHMIVGIFGPVLILYHCNFGTGSANANVALWSMLVVAASGLIGHFVYASVSAAFYADAHNARGKRDAIGGILAGIDIATKERAHILQALEDFDQRQLTPRHGVLASVVARISLERDRAAIARDISTYIGIVSNGLRFETSAHDQLCHTLASHFGAYMRLARRAAGRSIREQLWSRWRLFHLPVFLIMAVATVLHVIAVWGLDRPQASISEPTATEAAKVTSALELTSLPQEVAPTAPQPPSSRRVIAKAPTALPQTAPAFDLDPTLITNPQLATRPAVPARPASARNPTADGATGKVAAAAAALGDGATAVAVSETDQLWAELTRRTQEQPMALGGTKLRSLIEQIALLKARKQAGTFSHNDIETGFDLLGRHRKLDCMSCHTKPLRETRSSDPRTCIDCHKTDDVHRGRRPDCGQCHTPNGWGALIKRK